MPHYYFHIQDGVRLVVDKNGKELGNEEEAYREAMRLAEQVLSELGRTPNLANELNVEIRDAGGRLVGHVPLAHSSVSLGR